MLAGAGFAGRRGGRPGRCRLEPDRSRAMARGDAGRRCAAPMGVLRVDPGQSLQGTLRPYQQAGMQWLYLLTRLGLGACLADDMGLGKTIQVLSLLLVLKQRARQWQAMPAGGAGIAAGQLGGRDRRFAPSLKAVVAHPSAASDEATAKPVRGPAGRYRPRDHQLRLSGARRHGSARHRGDWWCSTRRRRSRIRPPNRPAPSNSSRPMRASRSPERRSRTGSATCGRSSTSSIRGSWVGEAVLVLRQTASPTGRTIRTGRCASWCGPTSCGG